ncbi:MAG TPA: STING domain-containing protein [Hanamia sp.]
MAIGYYNGFVKRVCEDLHHTEKMINGSDEFEVKKFVFKVIIPEELDDNGVDDFKVLYNKKYELSDASTIGKSGIKRGYPLAFKIDLEEDNSDTTTHSIIDIPSTLNTIVECIKLYMPHLQIGKNEDIDILEKKELWNFARVLKYLISKNASTKNNVIVIEGETI